MSLAAGQQIKRAGGAAEPMYGAYQYTMKRAKRAAFAPGKTADLVLLSADPTAGEAEEPVRV